MPAFETLDHYRPALIVLLGLATFAGALGVGFSLLRALRLSPDPPFAEAIAGLLGVATLSLLAQLLGMTGRSGTPELSALWFVFVLAGSIGLLARARGIAWPLPRPGSHIGWLLAGLTTAGAAMNLLLAAAPSTKIDEIHYQMLVPARMVLDGGLKFHLLPWEAAITPQMAYGIASAPLHALGYHDAPNVLSWCLGLLLTWFGARLVFVETSSPTFALLAAAGMQGGLYPSVFYTTGGSHALGDLATATGVLLVVFWERLRRGCSPAAAMAALSICCAAAASTKLSLVPLMGLVLLLGLGRLLRDAPGDRVGVVLAAALPWVVLYLPLCLWTLWQSGSPFGPMLTDVLAPSVYDGEIQAKIARVREATQHGLRYAVTDYAAHYPAVFALGAASALLLPAVDRTRRLLLGGLFVFQLVLLALFLPHYPRFLSGLHHALLIAGLIRLAPAASHWLTKPFAGTAIVFALTLPWLAAQAYRTWYLGPVALGLVEPAAYYRQYIALYDDFRELDRVLPADAVLYARQRLPSIYFPRPVYMHPRDVPEGRRAFALLGTSPLPLEEHDCAYMHLPEVCRFGEPSYVNPEARYLVYRRPGQEPAKARLEVREILGPR